jgi:hypothetical protein
LDTRTIPDIVDDDVNWVYMWTFRLQASLCHFEEKLRERERERERAGR